MKCNHRYTSAGSSSRNLTKTPCGGTTMKKMRRWLRMRRKWKEGVLRSLTKPKPRKQNEEGRARNGRGRRRRRRKRRRRKILKANERAASQQLSRESNHEATDVLRMTNYRVVAPLVYSHLDVYIHTHTHTHRHTHTHTSTRTSAHARTHATHSREAASSACMYMYVRCTPAAARRACYRRACKAYTLIVLCLTRACMARYSCM
mmetsp:Transcript_19360/g.36446  ORF Transcript_19360/g.36446 Transcript_19360/m.36446 type:complete len:204 (-) Transcript_19360:44-655(-)